MAAPGLLGLAPTLEITIRFVSRVISAMTFAPQPANSVCREVSPRSNDQTRRGLKDRNRLLACRDAEFTKDLAYMVAHRPFGMPSDDGNDRVGFSFGHPFQDLDLLQGEKAKSGSLVRRDALTKAKYFGLSQGSVRDHHGSQLLIAPKLLRIERQQRHAADASITMR